MDAVLLPQVLLPLDRKLPLAGFRDAIQQPHTFGLLFNGPPLIAR